MAAHQCQNLSVLHPAVPGLSEEVFVKPCKPWHPQGQAVNGYTSQQQHNWAFFQKLHLSSCRPLCSGGHSRFSNFPQGFPVCPLWRSVKLPLVLPCPPPSGHLAGSCQLQASSDLCSHLFPSVLAPPWVPEQHPEPSGEEGRRAEDGVGYIHFLRKELSTPVSKPRVQALNPQPEGMAKPRWWRTVARESRALLEGTIVPDVPSPETIQHLLRQRSWERRMQTPN